MASAGVSSHLPGHQEMLSAAELLLSVSPMFKPQPQRDRSWSMQSLETLVDVATRSEFSIGPSAREELLAQGAKKSKKAHRSFGTVKGRSLLQQAQQDHKKHELVQSRILPSIRLPIASTLAISTTSPVVATSNDLCVAVKGNMAGLSTSSSKRTSNNNKTSSVLSSSSATSVVDSLQIPGPIFPSILPPKYRTTYYRDGRVGVYSLAQREQLIKKYMDKKTRRVWTKKVRYSCRKNLAKQRERVKGRFVKTTEQLHARPEFDEEEEEM